MAQETAAAKLAGAAAREASEADGGLRRRANVFAPWSAPIPA
jgi:hypothetical protein